MGALKDIKVMVYTSISIPVITILAQLFFFFLIKKMLEMFKKNKDCWVYLLFQYNLLLILLNASCIKT